MSIADDIIEAVDDGDTRPLELIALDHVRTINSDEALARIAHIEALKAKRRLDRRTFQDAIDSQTPGQMLLPIIGMQIPAVIRGPDDTYRRRAAASYQDMDYHWDWTVDTAERHSGIAQRGRDRWKRSRDILEPEDDTQLVLEHVFSDTVCVICHGGWDLEKGEFEWAHDDPVAGRSDNSHVQYAHRVCNQEEGAR